MAMGLTNDLVLLEVEDLHDEPLWSPDDLGRRFVPLDYEHGPAAKFVRVWERISLRIQNSLPFGWISLMLCVDPMWPGFMKGSSVLNR